MSLLVLFRNITCLAYDDGTGNLSFEAGGSSLTGKGTFIFKTRQGREILALISEATERTKQNRQWAAPDSSVQENLYDELDQPSSCLPLHFLENSAYVTSTSSE